MAVAIFAMSLIYALTNDALRETILFQQNSGNIIPAYQEPLINDIWVVVPVLGTIALLMLMYVIITRRRAEAALGVEE